MLDDLKTRGRRLIARKRQSAPVRALHRIATFIDQSYENEEWDMCVNGETTVLRRLAPAGFRTAFDVGAHVGDWSIEALKAWPRAHVHAFEVAPVTYERLVRHVDSVGLAERCTLNCCGLGEATTTREMYYFPDHPQLTCDLQRHTFRSTPFRADLVHGDAYVRKHGLDTIDFLKIDVEGAEHLVLKGLEQTLQAGRIQCLQFEYGAFSIQTRVLLADYYEMLQSLFWIGKVYPTGVEFAEYDWRMESFRFSNFVCVSRQRPDLKEMVRDVAAGVAQRVAL